ncbi:MAG: holo-ACP synthase [Deltaproteobacteria bacterium]|nr:holo-ACP synthase [Deltaproteobacteria bacterium]
MPSVSSRPAVTTGIDASSIERISKAAGRKHFLERVFTEGEIACSFSRNDPYRHLAGRFAAKEACLKALTISMGRGINLRDIEVVNSPSGVPALELHAGAKQMLGERKAFLSISYSKGYAFAFVVMG